MARSSSFSAVLAMLAATEAVYLRPALLTGAASLYGSDYDQLHIFRLGFARDALFGAQHFLPAWYPREALGTPFAANIQSFPWIPSRLILLLFDPAVAYAAGIAMAAALAALFTWLYCRRAGLTRFGAAIAGWTFACAGYFASRVMAGHLPLLEAYPALPLLLWLADRALTPQRQNPRFDLAMLALAAACVVSAGHPQVPAYAMAVAIAYVCWRGSGTQRLRAGGSLIFGAGLASAAWWPMLLLIGRSTRILQLASPDNDISMPYGRLLALVIPGAQGWADPVARAAAEPFTGFPNSAYFWDTASYVGILPLIAVVALLAVAIRRRILPKGRNAFLTVVGVVALLLALPLANPLLHLLPGTILRSPARLLYISTFCVAFALGAAADRLTQMRNGYVFAAVLLIFHAGDLAWFDHWFIQTTPKPEFEPFEATLRQGVGNGRIALDRLDDSFSYENRYDDGGGFDSVFSARYIRGIGALADEPADWNEQDIDVSAFPAKALEAEGVKYVITRDERTDLQLIAQQTQSDGVIYLYRVPNPAPRAAYFTADRAEFLPADRIAGEYAKSSWDRLLLPPTVQEDARSMSPPPSSSDGSVKYFRPSSDETLLETSASGSGYAYVLESYDPGWEATVDGAPARILPANGFAMAVPVPSGTHKITLTYKTPGRSTGILISFICLGLLALVIAGVPRETRHPAAHVP